ncbi:MAG: lamin tail domain-containing protein [Bacteroidota bacterium]
MMRQFFWLALAGWLLFSGCETTIEGDTPYKVIVINELMPKNTRHGADQNGEYDDWIELFNLSDKDMDLTGVYLTDSKKELTKWKFPDGTVIPKNGFLLVWADGDTHQAGLHTNYKLSADGEKVLLVSPDLIIIDQVEYPATTEEKSYARLPNGTGNFVWTVPTINAPNE